MNFSSSPEHLQFTTCRHPTYVFVVKEKCCEVIWQKSQPQAASVESAELFENSPSPYLLLGKLCCLPQRRLPNTPHATSHPRQKAKLLFDVPAPLWVIIIWFDMFVDEHFTDKFLFCCSLVYTYSKTLYDSKPPLDRIQLLTLLDTCALAQGQPSTTLFARLPCKGEAGAHKICWSSYRPDEQEQQHSLLSRWYYTPIFYLACLKPSMATLHKTTFYGAPPFLLYCSFHESDHSQPLNRGEILLKALISHSISFSQPFPFL